VAVGDRYAQVVPQGARSQQPFGTPSSSCSLQTPIDDMAGVEGGIAGCIACLKLIHGVVSVPFHRNGEASSGSDRNDKLGA
jgi:hypothetical protein